MAIVGLVVIWHRGLIFDSGYLGLRDDWTIPPTAWQFAQLTADQLSALHPNFFGISDAERTMSSYLAYIWRGLAELPGIGVWLITRMPIAMIGLGGVFTYQAAKSLGLVRPAALAAAAVYMTTPFWLDAFVAGYMQMLVGIALLPKALQVAHEAFDRRPGVRGFARGFVWIGLSASTIHMAVITSALVGGYAIFRAVTACGSWRPRVQRLGYVAAMGTGVAFLHLPIAFISWQLVSIPAAADALGAQAGDAPVTWIKSAAPTLAEALTLTGLPYNYSASSSIAGEDAPVLPVIARGLLAGIGLVAPILLCGRARRLAVVLLLGFLAFILLGKGFNEPLSVIQEFVDASLLGAIFRNVRYWTIPAGLLLALLIGHVVAYLLARPPGLQRTVASACAAGVIGCSALPFWSGDLAGHLPPYTIDDDTVTVMSSMNDLPHTDRMLHVPMLGPSRYVSRSGQASPPGKNPFVLWSPKPTLYVSPQPTHNASYITALYHGLYSPNRYPIDPLLAFGRIRHVVLDPHWVSEYAAFILPTGEPWLQAHELHPRPQIALASQAGLNRQEHLSAGAVEVFDVTTPRSQRLAAPSRVIIGSPSLRPLVTAWFAFGDAGSVTVASGHAGVAGVEGAPGIALQHGSEIWLGADPTDLVANYLPTRPLVDPADQVWPETPDASGYWVATYKNAWWYVDPEVADLTRSVVTKADRAAFSVTVDTGRGTSELWVRHFVSPEGSALEVMLDGRSVGRIPTREAAAYGYRWTRIAVPTSRAGAHTIGVRTDGHGLNAVSQLGLLASADIAAAEAMAQEALARLPVATVLPDLATTAGDRAFNLSQPGRYTLQLAAAPDIDPTIRIDGVPVQLHRSSTASGYDLLTGTADLAAGSHRLELRTGPRPEPSAIRVTERLDGDQPCDAFVCQKTIRIEAEAPSDGRTVSFTGRLTTGQGDIEVIGAQAHPPVPHATYRELANQNDRRLRVDVPLDPGSSLATLELRSVFVGMTFTLSDVSVSRVPHGLAAVLTYTPEATVPAVAAVLTPTHHEPTLAAAVYQGEPGERLVRLDEAFDPRWLLYVNDEEVDARRHALVDGHFNAWAVTLAPGDELTARFASQVGYFWLHVGNLAVLAGMLLVGWAPLPHGWRRR